MAEFATNYNESINSKANDTTCICATCYKIIAYKEKSALNIIFLLWCRKSYRHFAQKTSIQRHHPSDRFIRVSLCFKNFEQIH